MSKHTAWYPFVDSGYPRHTVEEATRPESMTPWQHVTFTFAHPDYAAAAHAALLRAYPWETDAYTPGSFAVTCSGPDRDDAPTLARLTAVADAATPGVWPDVHAAVTRHPRSA